MDSEQTPQDIEEKVLDPQQVRDQIQDQLERFRGHLWGPRRHYTGRNDLHETLHGTGRFT